MVSGVLGLQQTSPACLQGVVTADLRLRSVLAHQLTRDNSSEAEQAHSDLTPVSVLLLCLHPAEMMFMSPESLSLVFNLCFLISTER